ncbi:MAG TPA: hypothetical protein VFD42_07550, partial [Chloroflexota bacterium]|nr:hypothetical protein [Chloroflexota bacterium]
MNDEGSLDELVSQAAEALYEDEAIRSKLADREASFLLYWAQGQLEIFARALVSRQGDADPADLFNAHVRRVRRVARGINALVGDRDALTDEEFSEELNSLLSSAGAPRAMPQAAELVAQRREMDPLALVARLASLATESWQIRGGSRPSASLPPVDSGRPLFQFSLPLLVLALVLIAAAVTAFFILRPSQGAGPSAPIPQGTGWYQVHFTAPL